MTEDDLREIERRNAFNHYWGGSANGVISDLIAEVRRLRERVPFANAEVTCYIDENGRRVTVPEEK